MEENSISDDDNSEEDDAIKMAIKLSEQQVQNDQMHHQSKFGEKNAQYQAMSEEDAIKMAMEQSMLSQREDESRIHG